jgi:hypothetical protein
MMVSDHSGPNGSGRTQIFFPGEVLMFDVAPGSDLLCARVSTYWVSPSPGPNPTIGDLRRSDLTAAAAVPVPGATGVVFLPAALPLTDVIAGGVADLQIAYRLSGEVGRALGQLADTTWAFDGPATNLGPEGRLAGTPRDWFEIREVRFNLLAQTPRRVEDQGNQMVDPMVGQNENRAAPLPPTATDRAFAKIKVVASESLPNLRLFDENTPELTSAEPF